MIIEILTKIANWYYFFIAELRANFWKLFVHKMGNKVYIMSHCMFTHPSGISFGNRVIVGHFSSIAGHGGVIIGNDVLIGAFCSILSVTHKYQDRTQLIMSQGDEVGKIIIGNDVWIGVHVTIMPNITIGEGSVIGANSVITRDVKPYSVVGGVPAKFIKSR